LKKEKTRRNWGDERAGCRGIPTSGGKLKRERAGGGRTKPAFRGRAGVNDSKREQRGSRAVRYNPQKQKKEAEKKEIGEKGHCEKTRRDRNHRLWGEVRGGGTTGEKRNGLASLSGSAVPQEGKAQEKKSLVMAQGSGDNGHDACGAKKKKTARNKGKGRRQHPREENSFAMNSMEGKKERVRRRKSGEKVWQDKKFIVTNHERKRQEKGVGG